MEVVSGELFYSLSKDPIGKPSESFTQYLDADRNSEAVKKLNRKKIEQLRYLRNKVSSDYYQSSLLPQYQSKKFASRVAQLRNNVLGQKKEQLFLKYQSLEMLKSQTDAALMKYVIEYGGICRKEIERSRKVLANEVRDCAESIKLAKEVRDIRVFAHHLSTETGGKVKLSLLEEDSAQSLRCRKAVYENAKKGFLESLGIDKMNISYVLKVEHVVLSRHLEVAAHEAGGAATQPAGNAAAGIAAAASPAPGKIKGLFCVVPKHLLHTFCGHGLGIQPLLSQYSGSSGAAVPGEDTSTESDQGAARHPLSRSHALRLEYRNAVHSSLFGSTPWFYFPVGVGAGTAKSPVSPRTSPRADLAIRPMVLNPGLADRHVMGSYAAKDTKIGVDRPPSSSFLRFFRHSTPLDILSESISAQGGAQEPYGECYLALCRVFILKMKTIHNADSKHNLFRCNTDLEDLDIQELLCKGFDAIYLQNSEEYILLQPRYVLPEFIMQVKYHRNLDPPAPAPAPSKSGKSSVASGSTSGVAFGPFVCASAEDCALGASKFLRYHPSKIATPSGVNGHDHVTSHADAEGEYGRPRPNAKTPTYIETVGAGDSISALLSSNDVETHLKATSTQTVYTELNMHSHSQQGASHSNSPRRVYPKLLQQRTLFDDIDEDLRKLGAGSFATPSGAGSPSKKNPNSLSPEASPTKLPRGEGVYTSSANASAFSTSVAIGKRKQAICMGIGKVIVEATQCINQTN